MARDLNQIVLIGRLVRDPEIKYTTAGTPVTKFSIANNVSYIQNDDRKDYVNYFDINVWGNQAINCEKYLKKGRRVAIVGSLRQNRWNDKNTGQTRSKIEVTASSVQFLSPVEGFTDDSSTQNQQNIETFNNTNNTNNTIDDPWNEESNEEFIDNNAKTENFDNDNDIPF